MYHRLTFISSVLGDTKMRQLLISRWRRLELASWADLLRSREEACARSAAVAWFSLARALNAEPTVFAAPAAHRQRTQRQTDKLFDGWLALSGSVPAWLHRAFQSSQASQAQEKPSPSKAQATAEESKPKPHAQAERAAQSLDKYIDSVFSLVDSFVRASSVGEFTFRLQILRIFALQGVLTAQGFGSSQGPTAKSTNMTTSAAAAARQQARTAAAHVLLGVWQFYSQFLPEVLTSRLYDTCSFFCLSFLPFLWKRFVLREVRPTFSEPQWLGELLSCRVSDLSGM
jgi:hypothetical protein